MAVTAAVLTSDGAQTGTSVTTASINLVAGRLYIIFVGTKINLSTPNQPTITGDSQTWAVVTTKPKTDAQAMRITAFRAVPSSNQTGALTIGFGGQSQERVGFIVIELSNIDDSAGANGSAAVVQSANVLTPGGGTSTVTSTSVTLNPFTKSGNAALGGVNLLDPNNSITPGSGFTELVEVEGNEINVEAEFKDNSATTVDWTFNASYGVGIALEINAAASNQDDNAYLM